MKQTFRDLSKLKPQTQKKLSVLGFFIIALLGVPLLYWIIWAVYTPWERIVRFLIDLL